MKIVIIGSTGRIGSAIAYDLVNNPSVAKVGLLGPRTSRLKELATSLKCEKCELEEVNIEDHKKLVSILGQYDSGIISLPNRRLSYKAIEAAIEAKLSVVDILEEYHRRPEAHETEGLEIPPGKSLEAYGEDLHNRAEMAGITILDGMGFAPGLSNITVQAGIDYLDEAHSVVARVGGIPSKETSERHPLKYLVTWSFEHVLREYMVKVNIRNNGRVEEVQALDDPETFDFTHFGKTEQLECFITPGMPSYIFTHPELEYFTEKTIRWPGHRSGILTLKECGLLDINPVEFEGVSVSPRKFMLRQLEPRLRPTGEDSDACVMYNTIKGTKEGKDCTIEYFLWDTEDKVNQITSMARVTGFAASIGGAMVAQGKIKLKGIVAPEEAIQGQLYDEFIGELKLRRIIVGREVS